MKNKILDKVILRILDAKTALFIALFAIVSFVIITLSFYHSEIIPYKFFEQATGNYAQLIAGVVGSLLSFSGIILIYVTFREQRESNKAQEIKLNQQTDLFNQQQFETTFFNLIENHFRIIRSFDAEFRGYLKNEKTEKSGHIQIDEHFRIFKYNYELISSYKLSAGYCNYQTINFYPLTNEHFDVPILKKSASNIQLIIDYISASKQIKESEKEIYGRILFTSLNESEVYFYVARSYWENGIKSFAYNDFNSCFIGQEMLKAVNFNLNQKLGFYAVNLDEPINRIVTTNAELGRDLKIIENQDGQKINLLQHTIKGNAISFHDGKLLLTAPHRKEIEFDFKAYLSEGGGYFHFAVPIALFAKELYSSRFTEEFVEDRSDFFLFHKLYFSYTIKTEDVLTKISYTVKLNYSILNEITLEFE